jgi:two-component system, chemotaxis family, protein-glutamate methylesterase/glutaminase
MTDHSNGSTQKQDSSGFAGTLRNIQITDIIQMCCLAGASLSIHVTQDNNQGTIYIEDGEIVHAECGTLAGIKAFFTILGWPSGQFETRESPLTADPTIKEPCQFLLMEAARQADERALEEKTGESEEEDLVSLDEEPLRVLIVDDSPIMSKILTSMLTADPNIDVVGTAKNGEDALQKMKQLSPDLITMDVNMPVMDGSTALKHIMISSPCPVLIMSNLLPSSYDTLLSFLNLGAVDFMSKPVRSSNIVLQQQKIVDRVHKAAKANMKQFHLLRRPKLNPSEFIPTERQAPCENLLIVNSGAGGYLEMVNLVTALPDVSHTGAISLQSVPPPFAPTLSSFLNVRSRFDVRPLQDKIILKSGCCCIGTSGESMWFDIEEGRLMLHSGKSDLEDPAQDRVDRILTNVAEIFQDRVVVMLLSGGSVGTMEGLRAVQATGGRIYAPEPDKCILPDSFIPAIDEGLITEIYKSDDVAEILTRCCV